MDSARWTAICGYKTQDGYKTWGHRRLILELKSTALWTSRWGQKGKNADESDLSEEILLTAVAVMHWGRFDYKNVTSWGFLKLRQL